jgi:hypothetical protein
MKGNSGLGVESLKLFLQKGTLLLAKRFEAGIKRREIAGQDMDVEGFFCGRLGRIHRHQNAFENPIVATIHEMNHAFFSSSFSFFT